MRDPTSLVPAFIRNKDLKDACLTHESAGGNTQYQRVLSISKGDTLRREDVAHYAMSTLYSNMLILFSTCRRDNIVELFENVGFLFHDWDAMTDRNMCNSNIKLFWVTKYDNFPDPVENVDVPDTLTVSSGEVDITEKNKGIFKNFAASLPEFEIFCTQRFWSIGMAGSR